MYFKETVNMYFRRTSNQQYAQIHTCSPETTGEPVRKNRHRQPKGNGHNSGHTKVNTPQGMPEYERTVSGDACYVAVLRCGARETL